MSYDKIVDSVALEQGLTDIGDLIRQKGKTVEKLSFPEGMKTAILKLPEKREGPDPMEQLIGRSITEVHTNAETIGNYAFYGCNSLTTLDGPFVRVAQYQSLYDCNKLTTINLPQLQELGDYVFQGCNSLTSIDFPQLRTIGYYCFYNCSNLTTINLPQIQTLGDSGFGSCSKLIAVNFPLVKEVSRHCFERCSNLETVTLPLAELLKESSFVGCNNLKTLQLLGQKKCAINSPGINNTCQIQVPFSILSQYLTDGAWAPYINQLVGKGRGLIPANNNLVLLFGEVKKVKIKIGEIDIVNATVDIVSSSSNIAIASQAVFESNTTLSFDITAQQFEGIVDFTITVTDDQGSISTTVQVKVFSSIPQPTYSVIEIPEATYGFKLNDAGYYESQNKGQNDSYSLCKVTFDTKGCHNLILDCINEGEGIYDFGLLSNVNIILSRSSNSDAQGVYFSFKGLNSKEVKTVKYINIPEGENFITIKYRKDSSTSKGNDSLQFKVRMERA